MATIELQQVEKKFGELHAVKPMDLTIQDGEFVVWAAVRRPPCA
jgi:ABC-type sugar transport system ATPase subunit